MQWTTNVGVTKSYIESSSLTTFLMDKMAHGNTTRHSNCVLYFPRSK